MKKFREKNALLHLCLFLEYKFVFKIQDLPPKIKKDCLVRG